MGSLPAMTAKEVETVLKRAGFTLGRHAGHRIWQKGEFTVPVPMHPGDIPKGTPRNIIRLSGMSIDEFLSHR